MITESDYDLIAREANFKWGANVTRYEVQEVLEYGNCLFLEPYEIEAIKQEARENGVH